MTNARLLRPPRIGRFLRSFPLHMRRLCAGNDRRKMLELGRPRYGDHYSDRLLDRPSGTRIDAYDGQAFCFPLRDAAGQMSGGLAEGQALASGRKGAPACGTREHDLTRPVGR
jgi:hypothetical protein